MLHTGSSGIREKADYRLAHAEKLNALALGALVNALGFDDLHGYLGCLGQRAGYS